MSPLRFFPFFALGSLTACSGLAKEPLFTLQGWGSMREVLREGDARGRVHLSSVVEEGTWGIGALEDLEGEITVVDGALSLAVAEDGVLVHRQPSHGDRAALLVLAKISSWTERDVPGVRTIGGLEAWLGGAVRDAGFDPLQAPVPLRIEGEFPQLSLHVINGSCPIADPDGSPPWRWSGEGVHGVVIGIYAEGQAGVLTHHARDSHLHVVLSTEDGLRVSGHVDELALGEGARLLLPANRVEAAAGHIEAIELR